MYSPENYVQLLQWCCAKTVYHNRNTVTFCKIHIIEDLVHKHINKLICGYLVRYHYSGFAMYTHADFNFSVRYRKTGFPDLGNNAGSHGHAHASDVIISFIGYPFNFLQ